MTNENTDERCERICSAIVSILHRGARTFNSLVIALGYNYQVLRPINPEDVRAALACLMRDGSIEEIETDGAPVFRVPAVLPATPDAPRSPVLSVVPADEDRRKGASRAIQGALLADRYSVRSTAKGTRAPFAGVVLSTSNAEFIAGQLAILHELSRAALTDHELGEKIAEAMRRARS
jgi:hypothetical protein